MREEKKKYFSKVKIYGAQMEQESFFRKEWNVNLQLMQFLLEKDSCGFMSN